MAILLYYDKQITFQGDIIEKKIWKVEKNKDFPDGVKYSLVYIHQKQKILGYNNERKKGHHKHYFNKEIRYKFINIQKLFYDFDNDVEKLRRIVYGKKEN